MKPYQVTNNLQQKAKYYGFDMSNIITRSVLGGQDTTQGKKTKRIGSVCSIRPARNKKRGCE